MYGAYNLNPFLVAVEMVPMLVVNQGQVAVVKAFVGLATEDTSGIDFLSSAHLSALGIAVYLGRTVTDRQVCDQPAGLRRRNRADIHPHLKLG